jgi:hypothetical protein
MIVFRSEDNSNKDAINIFVFPTYGNYTGISEIFAEIFLLAMLRRLKSFLIEFGSCYSEMVK